jgi:hypothetical protein
MERARGVRVFGYRRAAPELPQAESIADRQTITAFVAARGFELAQMFVETDPQQPMEAFGRLVQAARVAAADGVPVRAVVVPRPEHLGGTQRARGVLRQRLEREAGLRVLTATVPTEPGVDPQGP